MAPRVASTNQELRAAIEDQGTRADMSPRPWGAGSGADAMGPGNPWHPRSEFDNVRWPPLPPPRGPAFVPAVLRCQRERTASVAAGRLGLRLRVECDCPRAAPN